MKTITVAETTEALDRAIIERGPDYVYQKEEGECFYSFEDGSPACAVGAVFAIVAPEAFQHLVEFEAATEDGNGAIHRREYGGVTRITAGLADPLLDEHYRQYQLVRVEEPRLANALYALQQEQDRGSTWAEARAAYLDALRG